MNLGRRGGCVEVDPPARRASTTRGVAGGSAARMRRGPLGC